MMKVTFVFLAVVAAGLIDASPLIKHARRIFKRDVSQTDVDILNYALTLEHLEDTFYRQGLANFTQKDFVSNGFPDPFYDNLKNVSSDETTHVAFLTKALQVAGASPVSACKYNFPSSDVKSFVALANVLEGVGVTAYLGAAAQIVNKTYLTAAGSILSVEARHSAYLRSALGEVPAGQAFDNPLDLDEVYTLASPFIASCPSNNTKLPVKAFPELSVSPSGSSVSANSSISVTSSNSTASSGQVYAAFITVLGPVFTSVKKSNASSYSLTVPPGVSGQSYVVLTSSASNVTDDTVIAGPAVVEVNTP